MRLNFILGALTTVLVSSFTWSQALAQGQSTGAQILLQEMNQAAPAGNGVAEAVPGDAEKKPEAVAPAPAVPAIEELAPVAEPVKKETAPAIAPTQAPVVEELAPAPAVKEKEVAAPAAPVTEPVPNVEAAPAVVPAPAPAPKEALPVPAAPVVTAPVGDDATKEALQAAMKNLGTDERIKVASLVADQETVRRKAREMDGRLAMDAAEKALKNRDYGTAVEQYKVALNKLPAAPHCMALRDRATAQIPECEVQYVRSLVKGGKEEEAITKAKEYLAVRANPKLAALLEALKKDQIRAASAQSTETVTEERPGETEVEKLMRTGREFLVKRDYNEARARFESVLGLDPDNREAMRYLKVLGEREYSSRTAERDATARKMTAEVRETWNSKYKVIKGKEPVGPSDAKPPSNLLEEKMKKIVIDEIEFRQANMHDVVEFLNKRSRDCDRSTEDESKKGVNIILNLGEGRSGAATPKATANTDDVFGAPADGGKASSGVPGVTFSARYITLYNALKIITSVAGLKWRLDGDVVMIVTPDWTPDSMEMRMYPVEPTFITRVQEAGTAMPTVTRMGGKEKQSLEGGGIGEAVPSDLKGYFMNMGVNFPKGSSITYNSAIGKVIVANTADNLQVFERILSELNVVPKQVEIEARFVEVNETDMYEAGLEWLLTDNWEMLTKASSNPFSPVSANPRIQMNAGTTDGGVSKGLRFYGTDTNGKQIPVGGGTGNLGSIASFASVLTNPDITMILHALEQNGNADLLSAPKVTTRSGNEATMKVVTEYIYPTTFQIQGGQIGQNTGGGGGGNNANIIQETTVMPSDFATREVGVILNVLPEVSPDGNMINLTMKPQVVTDPIWYQYGSTVRRADGSQQQLNMPQPFFQVRSLETQISIYDGATVVMGGLITESLEKTNDKIPILGDIPLLGALFRSKSEKSVKKNLLIFVTAKLVDPSGQLIRKPDQDSSKAGAPSKPAAPTESTTVPAASGAGK